MKISLIGSGNVATHLAKELCRFYEVEQVFSPNFDHAETLAKLVNASAINDLSQILPADVYVIAVSDRAIQEVADQLAPYIYDAVVLHTSGSVDINVLSKASKHTGVLYPLQTFSKAKVVDFKEVPLLLEASSLETKKILNQLAKSLSTKLYDYSSAQRRSLHLAAVIACNFSNYLYTIANDYLAEQKVEFDLLKPLIMETATKMLDHVPQSVQTGPAVRGDQAVINKHIEMLHNKPELQQLYASLSQGIINRHND